MYTFSYMTSPVSILTTLISWKCFMKNDSFRSSVIEPQSFLHSKINVDPMCCVLMSLPCFMHVLCMTWYTQVDRIRILVILVHGIHRQKEHCLSVAQILTSRYQSRIDDGMLIDCTSDMIIVLEEVALNNHIVL